MLESLFTPAGAFDGQADLVAAARKSALRGGPNFWFWRGAGFTGGG